MPRKILVPESHTVKATLMKQSVLNRLFPAEKPVAVAHVFLDFETVVVRDVVDEWQVKEQRPSGFDIMQSETQGVGAAGLDIDSESADDLFDHI